MAAPYIPTPDHLKNALLLKFNSQGPIKNAAVAAREINAIYGEGAVNERLARRYFHEFSQGNYNLQSHQGEGGGHGDEVTDEDFEMALEERPFATQEELSKLLGKISSIL